ncbi:MAG TPA: hypothetical protein VFE01_00765 [Terracidiphilus sp.]|jgi:hypothetical protein|nr:hypothetical protein [Terracidiphilus sp.]
MNEQTNKMTCEEFQAQMPDLIASGDNVSAHPHVRECDLCRALLRDLETIAEAARQLFPVEDPPDRLWEQIESAIKQEEPSRG